MGGKEVHYGKDCRGWLVRSERGASVGGIVVLMEAFGLTEHIRGLCGKLAQAGYTALAPDLYRGKVFDYADVEGAIDALRRLDDETAIGEIDSAIDALKSQSVISDSHVGIVGFCMGGRLAFLTACRRPGKVRAASSFYGGGIAPSGTADRFGRPALVQEAGSIAAPLLLVYGARDQSIATDEHGRISSTLSRLDKRYTLSVYPGVGHGFCCEDRPAFVPASASSAFSELLAFFNNSFRHAPMP